MVSEAFHQGEFDWLVSEFRKAGSKERLDLLSQAVKDDRNDGADWVTDDRLKTLRDEYGKTRRRIESICF